jgi:hypothetical protein
MLNDLATTLDGPANISNDSSHQAIEKTNCSDEKASF